MRRRTLTLACLALLFPAFASAQGGPPRDRPSPPPIVRGTASIAGVVFSADSGRPLRLARISATAAELSDGGRVTTTDEAGRFELPELPAGRYTLSASKSGYITANFGQRRPLGAGRAVEVRDGQQVRGIDFRLSRGSAITGRVIDQDGEPLVRATVRALRLRSVQGEGRVEPAGSAETDDRGQFRIYNLQPGAYFVAAMANLSDLNAGLGRSAFVSANQVGSTTLSMSVVESWQSDGAAGGSFTYAPTYYPGVSMLADATPVTVGLADEIAGVDFSLRLLTAARVSGVVMGANGPSAGARVMLVPDDPRGITGGQGNYSAQANRDGTFAIASVPPGRYVVIGRGLGGRGGSTADADLFAVAPLTVSGRSVPGVTLVLGPGVTMTGQVSFEGATAPSAADIARIRIGLAGGVQLPMVGGTQMNTGPRLDGTFSIANVPPGTRTFRVAGLPLPWSLKAIYFDGRDVTDGPFEVRPGESGGRVSIVLTDQGGTIAGTVRDIRGLPFLECTAVVFAADDQLWRPQSRFIRAATPDKNGVFTIRGLPPGEYLVAAAEDLEQGEWFDTAILSALRMQATRVLIREGDQKSVDLRPLTLTR